MTILPLFWRFMTGMTACVKRNVPVKLKWISDVHSASVSSSVVAAGLAMIVLPPTAFTRMSIRPKRLAASATTLSALPASSASAW